MHGHVAHSHSHSGCFLLLPIPIPIPVVCFAEKGQLENIIEIDAIWRTHDLNFNMSTLVSYEVG